MKAIYRLSFVAVMMFFVTSCGDDFLELTPSQNIVNEQFLQSVDDFQAAMYGGYDQMQLADWYGRYMLLIPDAMGDDVKQNASANRAKDWAEYSGAPTTTQNEHREFWAEIYEAINMANAMINSDFEPASSVEQDFNQILGEAHALRALSYFDLCRLFAQHYTYTADASHIGVPLVLEFDKDAKPSRNTVAEVYDQIISDFQRGIALMQDDTDGATSGVFTRQAAQALLSRVYLYMEDYTNAEQLATEVINSGIFSLVDSASYANQFLAGNSSEAIFEIVFDGPDNPGSDHLGGMYKETGYGDYLPSRDLFAILDAGDVRSTMFLNDANLDGGIYADANGVGRRVNKYPSEGADIATDNIPVIRLSEVYLIRAEARAKMAAADEAGARADLNLIRQRAWPAAADVTATGQALLDEIALERRRELCFEGHRVFDITRNQEDLVRNDCTAPAAVCTVTYPNDRFILAIPQEETDVNPNVRQNDSYGQ